MDKKLISAVMKEMGSRGGKNRSAVLSAEERSSIAKKAAAKSAEVRSKRAAAKKALAKKVKKKA